MKVKYFNEIADIHEWYKNQLAWSRGGDYTKCHLDDIVRKMKALEYMLSLQRGYSIYEHVSTKPPKSLLIDCFRDRLIMLEVHYKSKDTYRRKRMFGVCNYYLFKLGYEVWYQKLPETIPGFYSKVNTSKILTLDDVDVSYDKRELALMGSALMHEIKSFGVKKFVERYTQYIHSGMYKTTAINKYSPYLFAKTYPAYDSYADTQMLNYIIALIDIMCTYEGLKRPVFTIPTLDKYILPALSQITIQRMPTNADKQLFIINRDYKNAISLFRDRGFLYSDLDCCVGQSFDLKGRGII